MIEFELGKGLLIMAAVCILNLVMAQGPQVTNQTSQLSSALVSCHPAIVGAKKAELIVQFYTVVPLAQGSFLKVSVPKGTSVVNGLISCGVGGFNDQNGLICQGVDDNALLFQLKYDLRPFESNVFNFVGAFNAPLSSEPTDTFKLQVLSADQSTVLAQNSQDVNLSLLSPNEMQGVTISQVAGASSVVGSKTKLSLSVTTLNPIPPGGGLQIKLPKWNPQASEISRISYITKEPNSPLCSVVSGMDQIECILTTSPIEDILVVKDMFPGGRLARDTFVFNINSALNPLSMSEVELTVTSYSSILSELNGSVFFKGLIDRGPAYLQAHLPAPIDPSNSIITADKTVVSEESQLIIPFSIPVPVMKSLGCTVLITLPDDFPVIAGKMTVFRGWGIFQGGFSNLIAQINEQQRTIQIMDQCAQYTDANKQSTLRIGLVQNPHLVKPTGSFMIQLLDTNGQLIASVESGVTYTPTAGTVNGIALLPESVTREVQEITDVELTFTPEHDVGTQGKIVIKMPEDLKAKCNIATAVGIDLPVNCRLADDGRVIELIDPFAREPYFAPQQLSIKFRSLQLPNSQRAIVGIQIETYQKLGNQYYLIDSIKDPKHEFFTPQSVTFLFSSVSTSPILSTYTRTAFRVSSTCASQVPRGSVMHLWVPAQITVANATLVRENCDAILNLSDEMKCTIQPNSDPKTLQLDGSHTITLTDAFDQPREKNDEIVFSIREGLITPISTETTESFRLTIVDAQGYEVNYIREALTITMFDGQRIEQIEVKPNNLTVGAKASHEIIFETPVPFQPGFQVQIFVPKQVIPPRAQDITCVGKNKLATELPCHLNGNRITVEVRKTQDIVIGDILSITVGPMTNPGSTQSTQPYQLVVRSASFYEVAEELDHPGAAIQMIKPSKITDYGFEVQDQRQKALTTVTIDWVSTQTYPKDTKIVIDYDQTQITPEFADPTSPSVPCIFRQSRLIKCTFEYNRIFIQDIMPSEEYGGSNMQLTITNMYINIEKPLTTDSWVLTTFLNDGISKIDRIEAGMSLTFECSYPCLSCLENQPSQCQSCNTVEGDLILYQETCYGLCPTGTFFEYFQCKLCDPKCLTCEYTSGTSCTSCDVNSAQPFLNGKDCSSTCNYGEFGNKKTAKCETCAYPCQQCVGTATTCTSCRQDSLDKFYLDNQCLSECPPTHYTESEARDNVCLPCSENCLTCELTADTCTSCPAGKILNKLNGRCVSECPAKISIYSPKNATHSIDTCEPCTSSCKTCELDTFHCTSCRNPLSLRPWEATCVLECDVFFQSSVSISNICVGCSSSCSKCQNQPDYCLECVKGTYFYQNKCHKQCPLIDDYQYKPDEDGMCVIPGLICPFGYRVNYDGNGCELKNQICETGYELNAEKTACIPAPTFYVPFPILATVILLCIIPITSRVKSKQTHMIPSLIAVIAPMETVCIVVLICGANEHGNLFTFYIGLVGFVFLFAGNAFFLLMYVNQINMDSAFKHWYPKNRRIVIFISILGFLNFKSFRLLYCRLFGRMCFDAPFTDPTLFYRPFNLTSLFAIVTVSLPMIVSSTLGLIYVRWGYQLYITCIEMLLISVLLLILQVAEYCRMKFEQKKYIKVSKREVEVKVRSTFADESDDDDNRRASYKPKAIRSMRHLEQYVATLEQKDRFAGEVQIKQVDDEIVQLHQVDMMHRQLRHCQSFRDLRPTLDDAFSGSEGEATDNFQDFISEPGSPRSKEMLFNKKLVGRIHVLHDAYKMRDQYDNCYHEPVNFLPNRLQHPVTKLQQTNVLEMLGIDDVRIGDESEPSDRDEDQRPGYQQKRLSRRRLNEIPEFDFSDIQGDFEADDNGQFLIIQKQGRLYDKRGRLVNRRGYLVDQIGNVITKTGRILFFTDELSAEDELPEPFCFDRIKQLKKPSANFRVKQQFMSQKSSSQEQLLKKKSSEMLNSLEQSIGEASQLVQDVQETSVKDEEDQFLQKLTKPKKPMSHQEIMQVRSESQEPVFRAARAPSQTSLHRVEQLQEMIGEKETQIERKKKSAVAPAQMFLSEPKYEIGHLYRQNEQKIESQRHKLLMDQEFIAKLEDFNEQLTKKRKEFNVASASANRSRYLARDNSDGRSGGLAHRNLNDVYGRVKQRLNQVNAGGPSASVNKRVKDTRIQQMESIYLNPRIDGKETGKKNRESLQHYMDQIEVTGQLRNIHHIKSGRESAPRQMSPTAGDVRSLQ